MRTFKMAVMIAFLLTTGLSATVFADPGLVYEMAALDQALIPVAALSNQGKLEATQTAAAKLQSQWDIFYGAVNNAYPGDAGWTKGLKTVENRIVQAVKTARKGNLTNVHEILEDVRNTLETLREERNIHYYLDGFSRYRRVMEKTTAILNGKKATDVTDKDITFVSSMIPALKSSWASVQEAELNPDLFHLDSAQVAAIWSAMDAVQKNIASLESVTSSGTPDQVFEALSRLKPSLKKAFLMFVKI